MRAPDHDRIPETALSWHREGRGAALATVVDTWGSAPRPIGAQLAISGASDLMGSVSGGCVEGAVIAEALEGIEAGDARLMEFGVSDDDAFAVGLTCGGRIRVLVEPIGSALPEEFLTTLVEARSERRPIAIETRIAPADTPIARIGRPEHRFLGYSDVPTRFDADRSGFEEAAPDRFISIHNPPLRLAIVGGVHIAQPLAAMARHAGYDVIVIDPREAFASPERFPGERLVHDWPDAALDALGLDLRTAVTLLTHDPKIDDAALMRALPSEAFYIGALGSKRTHAKRVARLQEAGFSEAQIARIDGPIGLDIGARSPAEIALSVLAEMTERLRRPETRPGSAA
ncbi:MAG: XdhC/CoxI family protein [Pseudomonadota bacterium]